MGSAAKKLTNDPVSSILTAGGLLLPAAIIGQQKQEAYDQKSKLNQLANQEPPTATPPPTQSQPLNTSQDRLRRIQAMKNGFSSTFNTTDMKMPIGPTGAKTLLGA
jgi:hypothetical protein